MAATFTEVSLEDMDKFLRRGFRSLKPKRGQQYNEYFYDLTLGRFVGLRVWTSVKTHSGQGADVGADAIRVQFVSLKDEKPLEKGRAPIVKRTQGWRTSLQDRIEDFIEKYEGNDEFWENWAGTRQVQRKPEPQVAPPKPVQVDWAEAEQEDAEEEDPRRAPAREWPATWARLRDGSWGIKVDGRPQPGDVAIVTKKDGTRQRKDIERVVWQQGNVAYCTVPLDRRASAMLDSSEDDVWKVSP